MKIHLVYKAVYKIALHRRSQCMYSIYIGNKMQEKLAENVNYCSAGLVEV